MRSTLRTKETRLLDDIAAAGFYGTMASNLRIIRSEFDQMEKAAGELIVEPTPQCFQHMMETNANQVSELMRRVESGSMTMERAYQDLLSIACATKVAVDKFLFRAQQRIDDSAVNGVRN